MLTEKDYCGNETSIALKELGYPTKMTFIGEFVTIEIPVNSGLIQLYEAQKWLREEKKIEVVVLGEKEIGGSYYADIYTESGYAGYVHKPCEKYEEALSEGIKAAVKILKEK